MKLRSVTIQNFMSVRKATVNLDNQGLVLVQGFNKDDSAFDSNGAGKSTIFESIVYSIFDKTIRGLKGDEVINDTVKKNTCVMLDFDDDNGVPYRIARYRKHNEHKNSVYIYRDNKNITPKSTKDSNKFIEELFQIDYDTFTNSIIFGQGLVKMFSVASDSEKKDILEKILSMTVLQDAETEAKRRLTETNETIVNIEKRVEKADGLIEEIKATIQSLKKSEEEHATNINEQIKKLSKELEERDRELTLEVAKDTDNEVKLESLEEKKAVITKELEKFKVYESHRNDYFIDLKSLMSDLKRVDADIEDLKVELTRTKETEGTSCAACGQAIPESKIEASLRYITDKIREKLVTKKELTASIEKKKAEVQKFDKFLVGRASVQQQRDDIVGEISEVTALINTRARIIKDLTWHVGALKDSIERLKGQLEETFKPLIEKKEAELNDFIKIRAEDIESIAYIKEKAKKIEFWVKSFGDKGIKSYLLDSVTPFLNKKANHYLRKLAGSTTEIVFSTQTQLKSGEVREKFDIQINNLVGGGSYTANSSGEKRRIDLAISLALQDLVMTRSSGKLNILLYDEIFDSLDAVGCENAIQLLQEIQKNVESIYVITHNNILKAYFDKYLTVTKENGMSTVKLEA